MERKSLAAKCIACTALNFFLSVVLFVSGTPSSALFLNMTVLGVLSLIIMRGILRDKPVSPMIASFGLTGALFILLLAFL